MLLMLMCSMTLSMSMLLMTHPLSIGVTLLIQSIIAAMMSTYLSINSWFSYIMFLVLIGGMLILFIYMTSIASNEKFMMEKKMIMSFVVAIMLTTAMLKTFDMSMSTMKTMTQENNLQLSMMFTKFWSNPLNKISMFMFMYLLITMIATIKITKKNSGPLRHMN